MDQPRMPRPGHAWRQDSDKVFPGTPPIFGTLLLYGGAGRGLSPISMGLSLPPYPFQGGPLGVGSGTPSHSFCFNKPMGSCWVCVCPTALWGPLCSAKQRLLRLHPLYWHCAQEVGVGHAMGQHVCPSVHPSPAPHGAAGPWGSLSICEAVGTAVGLSCHGAGPTVCGADPSVPLWGTPHTMGRNAVPGPGPAAPQTPSAQNLSVLSLSLLLMCPRPGAAPGGAGR